MAGQGEAIHPRVLELLEAHRCRFRQVFHSPVRTAEEAAEARGTPLRIGAKSIVFKIDGAFHLLVLSAAKELRSRLLRRALGARRTRFASAEELLELTGLEPGAVAPFGPPILPLPLLADQELLELPEIAFTPGVRDRSILIATEDWLRVARPQVLAFSR